MLGWLRVAANNVAGMALKPLGLELLREGVAHYPETIADEVVLMRKFQPYTMTRDRRQWNLLKAVDYLDRRAIAGDIVECGVWRGGNMMMVKEYRAKSPIRRRLFLFDTFAGMTEPTEHDFASDGRQARTTYKLLQRREHNAWAYAPIEEVTENFRRHQLLDDDVVFVKGPVEKTLYGAELPEKISLLRLDTDWYESTKVELEVLYPRLEIGGVIIIDDYGSWLGAKKAMDEYFKDKPLFLFAIDPGCRIAIKI